MENDYSKEHQYIIAKKRVEKIKGFYVHFAIYVAVNLFVSGIIIFGLTNDGDSFSEAFNNFGVYSTWVFWGIGLFFHWIGVFGSSFFFGKNWEQKQIKKYMDKE
ncbi:MAG: 2TM domain-containing protein [Flavobacteriaceae bacterium]